MWVYSPKCCFIPYSINLTNIISCWIWVGLLNSLVHCACTWDHTINKLCILSNNQQWVRTHAHEFLSQNITHYMIEMLGKYSKTLKITTTWNSLTLKVLLPMTHISYKQSWFWSINAFIYWIIGLFLWWWLSSHPWQWASN